ncbi:MAG: hypothetical protein LBT86_03945 [Deltaproteobacteria bacterium]|jgi:hypothetical protein|nr:hypothetical protein [Deltaproteobacteria bacterium]
MAKVLSATDGEINEQKILNNIYDVFDELSSKFSENKITKLMDILNNGLSSVFDDKNTINTQVQNNSQYGLAFALNYFFDKETKFFGKDKIIAETYGFDFNLKLVHMMINKTDENGQNIIKINSGINITASEFVGSEALNEVINYLLENVDNENAANYLNNLIPGTNVIDAISTSISIVTQENGKDMAKQYIGFLNINFTSDISSLFENMSFKGWNLDANSSSVNLRIANAEMDSILEAKNHQSLFTSWIDLSIGTETERQIDLTDLYEKYKKGTTIESFGKITYIDFKSNHGNLVNSII